MSPSAVLDLTRIALPRHCGVHSSERISWIVQAAQLRFKSSKYSEIRSLECEFSEGILFLRGRVSSYYLKQLAQEVVRSLEGIEKIVNDVEVAYSNAVLSTDSNASLP